MRLSELIHSRVFDASGAEVGKVHDVRLVQDGPLLGTFGNAFRVEGLIVGPAIAGTRLGYRRKGMRGPLLLEAPLRRLHRRVKFVPWARVASVERDTIRISGSADDLAEPEALDAR
jgi:uncharacterized protein YrrD